MSIRRTTWLPTATPGAQPFSNSKAQTTSDRLGSQQHPPSKPSTVKPREPRPTESHWELIIDRATD